jgi:hypothetical protein
MLGKPLHDIITGDEYRPFRGLFERIYTSGEAENLGYSLKLAMLVLIQYRDTADVKRALIETGKPLENELRFQSLPPARHASSSHRAKHASYRRDETFGRLYPKKPFRSPVQVLSWRGAGGSPRERLPGIDLSDRSETATRGGMVGPL